jgi:hypothetical protein
MSINPKVQNVVFEDESDRYLGNGRAYQLGFEYNF